jgi:threonine dehydrogenase-like Zn-dependent dehydrogenase
MKAVAVIPGKKEVALVDHLSSELSSPHDVRVRTLDVGICGTDREICQFLYGEPPQNSDYLVLGHEALGEVTEVGSREGTLQVGDLVVPSVRRPCPHGHCLACRHEHQDFCFTGDFTERGIKMVHGYLTEEFVEEEKHLSRVPRELRDVAVLIEPLTIAEKALAQIWRMQARIGWRPDPTAGELPGAGKTAVVLGAGPVGVLGAMALLVNGFRTFVYSRSREPNLKATLVNAIGAKYVSSEATPPAEFAKMTGSIDVVYEAIGVASVTFDVLKILGLNGVFVFTGIPPESPAIPIEADTLMRQIVLMNQVVIGTVNADHDAFEHAIRDLAAFKQRWPDALRSLITGRYPMTSYRELLLGKATGIKNVIAIGD